MENVLLGMQAAFVDIGKEKNTFIHIRDIIPKAPNSAVGVMAFCPYAGS